MFEEGSEEDSGGSGQLVAMQEELAVLRAALRHLERRVEGAVQG
eukprot:SAG22_NODE_704_length_7777_cov_6.153295_7_plen_44_part_00